MKSHHNVVCTFHHDGITKNMELLVSVLMMRQFGFLIYLAKMIKFGKSESPSRLVVNILLLAYQNIKI